MSKEIIIEEKNILKWSSKINKKNKLDIKIQKTIRISAKPFFNWLKNTKICDDKI